MQMIAGGSSRGGCDVGLDRAQRGFQHLLGARRGRGDDGGRFGQRAARGDQRGGDAVDVFHPHVDHDHLRAFRDRGPVQRGRCVARLVVAGHEGDRLVHVAVGHGDAGIGQPADARRNARDDADRNAVLDQRLRLFAAASKDERDRRPSGAARACPRGPDRPDAARYRAVWRMVCRRVCRHRYALPVAPSRGSRSRPVRHRR